MVNVSIPKPNHGNIEVKVVGDSPLLTNRFSEKARQKVVDNQTKKAKGGKEAKDPEENFRERIYRVDGECQEMDPREVDPESEQFGLPAVAFKKAMVRAAKHVDGLSMTDARNAFHVMGDIAAITYQKIKRNEARVNVGRGSLDVRFRPEFRGWECELNIRFDADLLSAEQVINLLNRAGFGVGVGDWRPENDGSYGMFHVEGCG